MEQNGNSSSTTISTSNMDSVRWAMLCATIRHTSVDNLAPHCAARGRPGLHTASEGRDSLPTRAWDIEPAAYEWEKVSKVNARARRLHATGGKKFGYLLNSSGIGGQNFNPTNAKKHRNVSKGTASVALTFLYGTLDFNFCKKKEDARNISGRKTRSWRLLMQYSFLGKEAFGKVPPCPAMAVRRFRPVASERADEERKTTFRIRAPIRFGVNFIDLAQTTNTAINKRITGQAIQDRRRDVVPHDQVWQTGSCTHQNVGDGREVEGNTACTWRGLAEKIIAPPPV